MAGNHLQCDKEAGVPVPVEISVDVLSTNQRTFDIETSISEGSVPY